MTADKIRVAFIFGGRSSEHDVSNYTAASVLQNLNRDRYEPVLIGITKSGRWLRYNGPEELIGSGAWELNAAQDGADSSGGSGKPVADCIDSTDNSKINKSVNDIRDTDRAEVTVVSCRGKQVADICEVRRSADVVFPLLHGCNGEDGTVHGFLELADLPYVGSGVLGSALGMDKAFAKIIFEKTGIPQCRHMVVRRREIRSDTGRIADEIQSALGFPCFIKPSNSGSSIGISKAHCREELAAALELAALYDSRILAEEFISCREIECAVLGNDEPEASITGEVIPSNEYYDYEAKYIKNDSKLIIPADIPQAKSDEIREYAVRAFKALDCSGLARADFFLQKETGRVYINELNTMPGFTSISMYPKLWAASGLPYPKLIEKLIDLAFVRYEDKKRIY